MPLASARAGPARIGARDGCSSRRATGGLEKMAVARASVGTHGDRPRLTGPLRDLSFLCGVSSLPWQTGIAAPLLRRRHFRVDHHEQLADAKLVHAGVTVM